MSRLEILTEALAATLGEQIVSTKTELGEVTIVVKAANLMDVATKLRDTPSLAFAQMTDLLGMDYSAFGGNWEGARFAIVYQLLSLTHNWRVRMRVFAADDDFPVVSSVIGVWAGANWYEREAFDLYGIIFEGHPDLRRILTDYGFVGHPFRKDFPVSGNVEMRYDPDQQRVIYQPVTIEPREITPRIIREENYADVQIDRKGV